MARGNNGNFLQHAVEAELGFRLAGQTKAARLHIALTHGMAPAGSFRSESEPASGLLHEWLAKANELNSEDECAGEGQVVLAYRRLDANGKQYPNTGEVLAVLLGRKNMTGTNCEIDPTINARLKEVWRDTGVQIQPAGDWRSSLDCLSRPSGSLTPWLISLDPYSFRRTPRPPVPFNYDPEDTAGGYLYPEDLDDLVSVVKSYVDGQELGAASIFCYSMGDSSRQAFKEAVRNRIVSPLNHQMSMLAVQVSAGGGKQHVGVILSPSNNFLYELRVGFTRLGITLEPE
jgi:hypothetical protein